MEALGSTRNCPTQHGCEDESIDRTVLVDDLDGTMDIQYMALPNVVDGFKERFVQIADHLQQQAEADD